MNDLKLILPRVYVGNLNEIKTSSTCITHLLAFSSQTSEIKNLKVLHKILRDHERFEIYNIFDECFKFIHEATSRDENALLIDSSSKSIIVTILVAYSMLTNKITFQEALKQINDKHFNVNLSDFLRRQLEIFEELDYDLSNKSLYKSKMLEFIAEKIQNGENVEHYYYNFHEDEEMNEEQSSYKCKKCRYLLFTSENQLKHNKPEDDAQSLKLNYKKKNLSESGECTRDIYIEPVSWLFDKIQELHGKIVCPKCSTKLGSYSWCGHSCSCGTWMVPAFQISESRVDFCKAIVK